MNIDFLTIFWVVFLTLMKSVKFIFALFLLNGALYADQSLTAKPVAIAARAGSFTQRVASGVTVSEMPTQEWYRTAVMILGIGAVMICFAQALMTFKKKA